MMGAARGYAVKLCMPENVTPERKRILRAYGAELVLTDPMEGSDGAIREVRASTPTTRTATSTPTSTATPRTGARTTTTTGPEILAQTDGRITHFVAGLGTSGTFVGIGRFFREHAPDVRLISVQPDTALHGLEGLKHMESAIVPPIYDPSLADEDRARRHRRRRTLLTRRLATRGGPAGRDLERRGAVGRPRCDRRTLDRRASS